MSTPQHGSSPDPNTALNHARVIVAGLVVGVLVLTAVSGWFSRADGLEVLVLPTAVIGAVSPVIGYRLYHLLRDRIPGDATVRQRQQSFVRANVVALAVTEGAALLGVIVHALTGNWLALLGVLMHVLLAGALWPSPERLETFVEGTRHAGSGG